jgi:aminoglycoside 3-N-acetyltransferase
MKTDLNRIYTKDDILAQLAGMNIPRDRVVLAHSSLRLVGKLENGAKSLLDAMIEYFTAEGGLFCVPTHTWGNLSKEITLDMADPTTCLGAFSDFAAADPRGRRSLNATHSMAVFGDEDRVAAFVDGEDGISSGTAPESCYGKIYREGGYILLIGVSHARNTYLHCVDEILGVPNRITKEPREVKIRLASGEILTRYMRCHHTDYTNDISLRFPKYETAFRYHGAITDGFIGHAPAQACDTVIMKEVMELIRQRSGDIDPLRDESTIAPRLYR